MSRHVVRYASLIPAPVERVEQLHREPGALAALTPPPVMVQVLRDERTALTAGELEFILWIGPIPVRWLARHEPGPVPESFADSQVRGPLAYWRHEHVFAQVAGGTMLVDRITIEHRPGCAGLLTRLFFDGLSLRTLFVFRHWRTKRAVQRR